MLYLLPSMPLYFISRTKLLHLFLIVVRLFKNILINPELLTYHPVATNRNCTQPILHLSGFSILNALGGRFAKRPYSKQTSGRTFLGAPPMRLWGYAFYFLLKQEELRAAVEAEGLDGTGHHFLAAGEAHGGDGLDFAEVDDEAVRIGRARAIPTGVPKGFEVAVEY